MQQFPCPAGFECTTSEAIELSPGKYSAYEQSDSQSCTSSDAACPDPASLEHSIDCAALPRYYFGTDADVEKCTICEAGYYCPAGSASRIACDVGQYSLEGSFVCKDCPAGHFCDATDSPLVQRCPLGEY